jgi:hypothetical protein
MEEEPLSSSKLNLISLLHEARRIVRFASESECDSLFFELGEFTEKALDTTRSFSHGNLQALTGGASVDVSTAERRPTCRCDSFSLCDPSSRDPKRCQCCEHSEEKREVMAYEEDVFCAECLCNLHVTPATELFELGF